MIPEAVLESNYYSPLDDDDDDDVTVVISNRSIDKPPTVQQPQTVSQQKNQIISQPSSMRAQAWNQIISQQQLRGDTAFQMGKINIAVEQAIADAGATGHFVVPGAPVEDVRPATNPLTINLPDGEQIKSTHVCKLRVPWLPEAARTAHIVPGLAHTSLISIKVLIDAGCYVTYDSTSCKVFYKGQVVWRGTKEPSTGLWVLPMTPTTPPTPTEQLPMEHSEHYANNAYAMTSKQALIRYLHQCLFSPPKRTLTKACENNQLATWPGLTAKAVKEHLPESSPATDKGHMKRQRQGLRTTKEKIKDKLDDLETDRDINPPQENEKFNQLFCYAGSIDRKAGTIYVDLTGNFPLRSLDGHMTVFILYDWTTNAILAEPIRDAKDETMVDTLKKQVEYLSARGFKPQFNIIDNVASKAVKAYLTKENIKLQLVEPHNHRVNAAERAIQTFKNHFIAGMCTTDKDYPLALWHHNIRQAQDTLNMLRTSRVHPKISAYHVLEGTHDFNRVPYAPPGTRATIFDPPETRTSWGPRSIDAWYLHPAYDHYRCWTFYVPGTGGIRTSGQATFYPTHCEMPLETPMDEATRAAKALTNALRRLRDGPVGLSGRHGEALARLSAIFNEKAGHDVTEDLPMQTSTNPTAPAQVRAAPRVHGRNTRNNTPGILC
mgnify:CR=1 FL=1